MLALSPLSEQHQLLVGQRLDGWPQVEVLDAHGVIVRGALVRFTVSGSAASFEGAADGVFDTESNNRGRAVASGLHGESPGEATVVVTLPNSAAETPLRYTVHVPGPTEV